MTYEEFNAFCGALPAATHVVQWGGSHVWKVGGKVFAIGGWERGDGGTNGDGAHVTFKTSEISFEILKDQPGCRPAPYLASRGMKWIQRTDDSSLSDDDLRAYIEQSHRLVAQGLSKKKRKELGLTPD